MAAKAAAGPGRGYKLNLAFGLVNVPVRYKPLNETGSTISAKTLCPEHHEPVKAGLWVCSGGTTQEHTVERDAVIKGYPHPDNPSQFVLVETSVLEEFAESKSGNAQIEKIVDSSTIDPAYFDKTYLIWPDVGGEAAFDLLSAVLRAEKRAAVTTAVISKQTQTVVFRWSEEFECLLAHVCRFATQIRHGDIDTVKAVSAGRAEPPKEQVAAAKALLDTLTGEFDPSEVEDTWTPAVQDAIRQVAAGQPVKVAVAAPVAKADDLMATLMASLETPAKTKAPAKPRAKKEKATA
jgi:DNA end-binding protein Ku